MVYILLDPKLDSKVMTDNLSVDLEGKKTTSTNQMRHQT
jgi:hypothetical protein